MGDAPGSDHTSAEPAQGTGVTGQRVAARAEVQSPGVGISASPVPLAQTTPLEGCAWRALGQGRGDGGVWPYLRVLHQIVAALEPVVELGHPPRSDDLDMGRGVRPGQPLLALSCRAGRSGKGPEAPPGTWVGALCTPRGVGRGAPLGRGITRPAVLEGGFGEA